MQHTLIQLPPLPIIDGWLFVDNSKVETICGCNRAAQYSWLHQRRAAGERSALNFGAGIHCAKEARYKVSTDISTPGLEQAMFNALTKHFEEHPQEGEDEYRTLDHATKLVKRYNQKYPTETFEVCKLDTGLPCVELPFSYPLVDETGEPITFCTVQNGNPILFHVMYTGKIDLIISEYSQIFTMDHKTTFQLGQTFWQAQQMTSQHVGYCVAVDKLLGVQTAGYKINALCTRKFSKSRPAHDAADFERNTFYVTPERKLEWHRNLVSKLKMFFYNYSQGHLPMFENACVGKFGPCQFFDICSLPELQRGMMLESNLFVDDNWSPLNAKGDDKATPITTTI